MYSLFYACIYSRARVLATGDMDVALGRLQLCKNCQKQMQMNSGGVLPSETGVKSTRGAVESGVFGKSWEHTMAMHTIC